MARVLIVDDVESVRTSLAAFVEKDGHDVSLAADASEALALLREEPFDVVVTDIILPRKTGVVLLGEIREAKPDVQVIMITGEPEVVTAAEAVRKGAFDYLSKPVSREAITRTVSAAAAKKTLLDKNRLLEDENRQYQEHLEELVEARTKQLQDSEAHLTVLFERAPDAYYLSNLKGTFIDGNKAAEEMIGYSKEELVGKSFLKLKLLSPKQITRAATFLAKNVLGKDTGPDEFVLTRRDGSKVPVEIRTHPVKIQGKTLILGLARDISARKGAEERTKRLLDQQTCINELALELGNVSDIDRIYESIYRHVSVLMDAKSFIISFYDEEEQLLRAGCALFQDKAFDVTKLPPIPLAEEGHGTQSRVIHTGEPLYVPDYRKARKKGSTEYTVDSKGTLRKGAPPEGEEDITRSTLYVPLKLEGKVIGVMQVQSNQLDAYSQEYIELLSGLANVAAVAIQNARLYMQIQSTLDGAIQAIAKATEIRDPYTAGHQQQVSLLACAIAEELGLSPDRIQGIRVSSLMHDIGKMAIPAEILAKPGVLTDVEFNLIKAHTQAGADILKEIDSPWPLDEIEIQHHERLDGSGYPNGLKGDEIMLEAQILGVADVIEAMSSHRPYRAALGIDAALAEIKSKKGTCYNSDVVDACVRLFAAGFGASDENIA